MIPLSILWNHPTCYLQFPFSRLILVEHVSSFVISKTPFKPDEGTAAISRTWRANTRRLALSQTTAHRETGGRASHQATHTLTSRLTVSFQNKRTLCVTQQTKHSSRRGNFLEWEAKRWGQNTWNTQCSRWICDHFVTYTLRKCHTKFYTWYLIYQIPCTADSWRSHRPRPTLTK